MTFPSLPSLRDDNNNPLRPLHTSCSQFIHFKVTIGHRHQRVVDHFTDGETEALIDASTCQGRDLHSRKAPGS